MNYLFASFGNDSLALIQWARNERLKDVHVVYNNTGWSEPAWADRVLKCSEWVTQLGFTFHETASIGFLELAKKKKAFPRQGMQFCTKELKEVPSMELLGKLDPDKEGTCIVGVRREESKNRAQFPEWTEDSERHEGRSLWAPLVRHTEKMRNDLLEQAGFEPLPHRSMECYPCVNANRKDLQQVSEERIRIIESMEEEMGVGVNSGKPKTMFRPYRHQGAVGIRNVMKWANNGHYIQGQTELWDSGCEGGFCE